MPRSTPGSTTRPAADAPGVPADVARLEEQASDAARRAGVKVRLLEAHAEMRRAADLFEQVWGTSEATANLLKALAWSGHFVSGAWEGDRLVGGAFGFRGGPAGGRGLHSHVLAAAPGHQGRGVGYALKLHQRAWAAAESIDEITWTFDPLVRRNGWFNLVKLGGRAGTYYPNFYGRLPDALNGADDTDRCLVRWRVAGDTPAAAPPLSAAPGGSRILLGEDGAQRPRAAPFDARTGVWLCQVPLDVVAMRRRAPDQARAWRLAVRETMGRALDAGYTATSMTREGFYVLTRPVA